MIIQNIAELAKENTNFRKVLVTGAHSQLVLMSLRAGEEIGEEIHKDTDQTFFVVDGEALTIIDDVTEQVTEGDVVFVSAGLVHNVRNAADKELKLVTVYAPAHHPEGTIKKTK